MLTLTAAIAAAEKIDKAVGIVAKVIDKLKAQPDIAAQKLGQALAEIAKTLQVVDNAAAEYLSLGIDAGALEKNSKTLLEIEGGRLKTEVERGRGHCHIIGEIYYQYLNRWFLKVLKGDEYNEINRVFMDLGNADDDLFVHLTHVASSLESEAADVLDLVVKNDVSGARARVLSALPVVRPLRKTMAGTMQTLYSMQSSFVDIAGGV
jgi:hypothetical protein